MAGCYWEFWGWYCLWIFQKPGTDSTQQRSTNRRAVEPRNFAQEPRAAFRGIREGESRRSGGMCFLRAGSSLCGFRGPPGRSNWLPPAPPAAAMDLSPRNEPPVPSRQRRSRCGNLPASAGIPQRGAAPETCSLAVIKRSGGQAVRVLSTTGGCSFTVGLSPVQHVS